MIDSLGAVLVSRQTARREMFSARPDAPVVPDRRAAAAHPRLRRTRAATAGVLFRAASRVSPA